MPSSYDTLKRCPDTNHAFFSKLLGVRARSRILHIKDDSLESLESVDPFKRSEYQGSEDRNQGFGPRPVESCFYASQATFRGPHVLQHFLLYRDILNFAGVPHLGQV